MRLGSLIAATATVIAVTACESNDGPSNEASNAAVTSATAIVDDARGAASRRVSPADAAALIDDPPDDLVVLDVRTPEEFAEGHLADAALLDFYRADFAEQVAELDRDVPYVVYCRSGNRSGRTAALMEDLGFTDVTDVDGGILAWSKAQLPVVVP
ncbi:MAG: rhodanese-like domain-containing protein [Actinomycetota bacterium]